MKAHWQYLKYVIRHKWYVFGVCYWLGIPWLGLMHDWSKFLPDEWMAYVHHLFLPDGTPKQRGDYKPTDIGDPAFDFAWLLHQKRNRHHWQWWALLEDGGKLKVLAMPQKYRLEMLADWRGAGMAQGKPDALAWYTENRGKMQLHPETRQWVEMQLGYQP